MALVILSTKDVDVHMLKQQRDTLHAVLGGFGISRADLAEAAEHLSGIENLLEHIYDTLVPAGGKANAPAGPPVD